MEDDERALGSGMSSARLGHLARVERYIRANLRLEAAHRDLENPHHGETIAEIAYRWGFGDQAQFSRHFKSHYGKTPREVKAVPSRENPGPNTE